MINVLASGFLFVGGAIMMTVVHFGTVVPILGAVCTAIGAGWLLYQLFLEDN